MAIEKQVLKNGLAVYTERMKGFGETATFMQVHAGSWHDEVPETAHVLEHVVGVEAKVYGPKGRLDYVDANASTQVGETEYYFNNILPEHLLDALVYLSTVLKEPKNSLLEREKEAVRHELAPNMNPYQRLKEKVGDTLFPNFGKKKIIMLKYVSNHYNT